MESIKFTKTGCASVPPSYVIHYKQINPAQHVVPPPIQGAVPCPSDQHISADYETLMRQAPSTAQLYLSQAIIDIDGELGKGYARANPLLIAAYMQVAASDFATSCRGVSEQHKVEQRYALADNEKSTT